MKPNSNEKYPIPGSPGLTFGAGRTYTDVLLVLFIIVFSTALRLPSLRIEAVLNEGDRLHFMTAEGLPYLSEMDSYYYAWFARSISEGMPIDLAASSGLPLLGYLIWRVISLFRPVSLYAVLVYMSPFTASLAAVPAYVFVRKRTGRLGAFTAGMMAATTAAFLIKSGFACFDTDILLCLLPLTAICSYVEAAESKTIGKRCVWSSVSILSFGYLAVTWRGYTVYLCLAVGIWSVLLLLRLLIKSDITRRAFFTGTVLTAVYALTILAVYGFRLSETGEYLNLYTASDTGALGLGFPPSNTFIGELADMPLISKEVLDVTGYGIINRLGGIIIVAVSFITLIVMICKAVKILIGLFAESFGRKKNAEKTENTEKTDIGDAPAEEDNFDENINTLITTATFAMWAAGGAIAPLMGARFVELTAVPLCIIGGLGIGYFGTAFKKIGLGFSSWVLVLAMLILPCRGAYYLASHQLSIVDDTLQEACEYIDTFTAGDSVVASWWDYGYYYEYETHRKALADGGTFDGRTYYWLAKALITDDERLSAGIFRMMAVSGTQASQKADLIAGSNKEGSMLIEKLLKMEPEEGRRYLADTYADTSGDMLQELADMVYPDHVPEIAVIITQDMFSKIRAISYYGMWDFTGNDSGSGIVSGEMMMYRLYTGDKDMEYYRYGKAFEDPADMCSSNVWIIPEQNRM